MGELHRRREMFERELFKVTPIVKIVAGASKLIYRKVTARLYRK
jgi:DNA-binding helix-hairpin-helix protein with protein kinase domain